MGHMTFSGFDREEESQPLEGLDLLAYADEALRRTKGCPCACHNTREVWHVVPCHNPLLGPFDPSLPKTILG